jgi:PASTA domain/Bacterial Ig-like domain
MILRTPDDPAARARRPSRLRLLGLSALLIVVMLGVFAGSSGAGVADYTGPLYLSGPGSSVSGSYQLLTASPPAAPGSNPVASVAGVGMVPAAIYQYIYVISNGSSRSASAASNQLNVPANSSVSVANVPVGSLVFRQKVMSGAPVPLNPYVLVSPAGGTTTTPFVDDGSISSSPALPQADARVQAAVTCATAGACGYVEFTPGFSYATSTAFGSPAALGTVPAAPSIPATCKGWTVDNPGSVSFAAGNWQFQVRVRANSGATGTAYLTTGMWKVDDSGAPVAGGTLIDPTQASSDGSQNLIVAGSTQTITYSTPATVPAFNLASNQHLCVQFWRHQTAPSGSTALPRTLSLLGYDPANQITAHPAPDAFPNTPTPSAPDAGAVVASIPTLNAGYSDPEASAGTLTFRICPDAGCSNVTATSPAQAVASGASAGWAPAALADGTWYWQARATDSVGGTSYWSSARSFRLDRVFPNTPTLVSPVGAAVTSSSLLTASFTSADVAETGTVEFRVCTDVLCGSVLRSGSSGSVTNGSNGTWTISPALGDGTYGFQARTVDAAGNASSWSAGNLFTLDTTPPDTTIGSSPATPTNVTGASFSFSSTEGSSTYRCSLDGAAFSGCSSPASYSGLADAAHTFQVEAIDQAGNTDPSPASYTWTVDTVPPDTTVGPTKPAAVAISSTAVFDLGSTEPGSSFRCSRDGGAWSACTSPKTYTGLADGNHTFSLEATDAAGNVDGTPASYSWSIDTTVPATPTALSPVDELWTATIPQLSGKFTDPTSSDTGTVQFRLCSTAASAGNACADLQQSGSSGSLASGSTGSWTPAALGDGIYHWQARGQDTAGNASPWTATRSIHLDSTTPSIPFAVGPDDGAWQSHTALRATFNDSAFGATGTLTFRLCPDPACLSVTESGDSATVTNGTTVEWHGWFDPADGLYYWQARANDGAGNQSAWSAPRMVHLDKTPPPAPTSFNGTIAENGLTLRWDPPTPADDVANFYVYVDGVSTKSLGGVTYEYNVGAFDAGDRRTFGVVSVDGAGNQSEMSPLLVGVPNVVGMTWSQAGDAAKARGLLVRRDATVKGASAAGVVTAQTPAAGTVAVKGTAVKVVLSGPTLAPSSLEMSASPARVVCGAGSVVRLRVRLTDAANLRARLLSAQRVVASASLGRHQAGSSDVRFKLPGRLRRGTYRLVLDASAGTRKAQTAVSVVSGSRRACGSR